MPSLSSLRIAAILYLVAFPASFSQATDSRATPEGPSGSQTKLAVIALTQMVVAANPLAAEAGRDILRQGGSAIDAAIAVQMVLNLVEPQSSGIGGGAFLLLWNAETKTLGAYDGRETAPATALTSRFLKDNGKPMGFFDAVVGGRAIGVPGLLRMLEAAHAKDGRLPWKALFQPAIKLALQGFKISPRLHSLLVREKHLHRFEPARSFYFNWGGIPKPVGTRLINKPLAETLQAIAEGGADVFYTGAIAQDIVRTVQSAPGGGDLSLKDMEGYRAISRTPVCAPYRAYKVCGMPPPTSGGVAVLQALGILHNFELSNLPPGSAKAAHLIAEAERLAFADRNKYLADSDFVEVPVQALLDPAYLKERAKLISLERSMGKANAGVIPMRKGETFGPSLSPERPSTSHISVVDKWGNGVSMTSSIENAFGSRLMVRGFLLNNQLTDFSFRPDRNGLPVANRVEPGKRPRSSMAPTMVFSGDGQQLYLAVGSPGGSRIIPYVIQAIIGVLDWGMDAQAAVNQPHISNRNGPTELETDTLQTGLEALGHTVRITPMTSGLHAIRRTDTMELEGGADPRREGVALGD